MEEQEESNGSEHANGELSEDQGVEEVELDESVTQREPSYSNPTTYGGLLLDGTGTTVEGYEAVNKGLNKFVQPKYFAMLLFAAAEGKMPWISEFVPQKIMCNCVFVIDLKKLESENALFKDGLGSWIQNCGKVMNYFVVEENSAIREVKAGTHPHQAVEFIRRIDKNASCPVYTRVTVVCSQLGLAILQYFFKGAEEQTFPISYSRPPKKVPTTSDSSIADDSPPQQNGSAASRNQTRSRKRRLDEVDGDLSHFTNSGSGRVPVVSRNAQVSNNAQRSQWTGGFLQHKDEISASNLILYLREHIRTEREDRNEERRLRREELESRRQERLREELYRKEDLALRRQELELQRARLELEQQKWEVDRKEKDVILDFLKTKLQEP